jgi:hypothetical protein
MSKPAKCYPDTYAIADFPSGKNPEPGTAELWRSPSGWSEKRSDGKVYQLCMAVKFDRPPTIADLDTPWDIWWHYEWDMSNLKAIVWKYERSPIENDIFKSHSAWEVPVDLTPTLLENGYKRTSLPQGNLFDFMVTRDSTLNQAQFPAGVLSGISSSYLDVNKNALSTGARGHIVSATDTAAGLGILVAAPPEAKFTRYVFQYITGGALTYDFAI